MDDRAYHPIGSAFSVERSIRHGFAAVRVAAAPLWLGGLLVWISGGNSAPVGLAMHLLQLSGDDSGEWSRVFPAASPERFGASLLDINQGEAIAMLVGVALFALVVGLALALLLFAFYCWLQPGFLRLHASVIEHASDATAPLFSGKDKFWAALGWNALDRLALTAALCVVAWPGALLGFVGWRIGSPTLQAAGATLAVLFAIPVSIYVGLGTYLGAHAVVLENRGPVHALRRSWALARGNRFALLFFATVCVLLELASFAGVVLCCVGLLATAPFAVAITGLARTEGFLLMTRGTGASRSWALWQTQAAEDQAGGSGAAPPPPPGVHASAATPRAGPAAPAGREIPRGWEAHLQAPEPEDGGSDENER